MAALELADTRGLVNLRAVGVRDTGSGPKPVALSYRTDGTYKDNPQALSLTHAQLIAEAQAGTTILTLTGALRSKFGTAEGPQPLLGACLTGCSSTTGDPSLPRFSTSGSSNPAAFSVVGTDVRSDAAIFVNGAPATGTIACGAGTTGSFCNNGSVSIDLAAKPPTGLQLRPGAEPGRSAQQRAAALRGERIELQLGRRDANAASQSRRAPWARAARRSVPQRGRISLPVRDLEFEHRQRRRREALAQPRAHRVVAARRRAAARVRAGPGCGPRRAPRHARSSTSASRSRIVCGSAR